MSPKRIDDLVVAAARAEPMTLGDRGRLVTALEGSSALRADLRAQEALTVGLTSLGASLRAARSRRDVEPTLRAAFRSRPHRSARPGRRRVPALAAAAAVALILGWLASSQRPNPEAELDQPAVATNASAGFQPLIYAPNPSPSRSYSVVRVEIPLSTLALQYAGDFDGVIEADILVGEDGLPAGIRFVPSDGALAQTTVE